MFVTRVLHSAVFALAFTFDYMDESAEADADDDTHGEKKLKMFDFR